MGTLTRLIMLGRRFDFTGKKMKAVVKAINEIGIAYNYKPALIIPAVILKRYINIFRKLKAEFIEFGIHGYTHINYKKLTLQEQIEHISKAVKIFKENQFEYYGFRSPYLSYNDNTIEAVRKNHLSWQSNETLEVDKYLRYQNSEVRKFQQNAIKFLYDPQNIEHQRALPRFYKSVVSIPILLPDDEMLIDRYAITDSNKIKEIWIDMLKMVQQRGEMFILQLHPERYSFCNDAMYSLLETCKSSSSNIWLTSMHEISSWWQEKNQFQFAFQKKENKGYTIHSDCTERATILCRNCNNANPGDYFFNDYHKINTKIFFIESNNKKPCIGIHPQCPDTVYDFIKNEGFAYEISEHENKYSLYLNDKTTFQQLNEIELLNNIEQNKNPLVRFWVWPNNYKSAFTTTHDLDSVTFQDFLFRLFEN